MNLLSDKCEVRKMPNGLQYAKMCEADKLAMSRSDTDDDIIGKLGELYVIQGVVVGWNLVKVKDIKADSVPKRFGRFLMVVRSLLVVFTYKNRKRRIEKAWLWNKQS